MSNNSLRLMTITFVAFVLTACGKSDGQQAATAPQPAATTNSSGGNNDGVANKLQSGVGYNYFGDGSCSDHCLTKSDAEAACNDVKGYTKGMLRYLAVTASGKDKALLEGGNVEDFNVHWTGNSCRASITLSGVYDGSSARSNISGAANQFIVTDGKILVHSVDTFAH